MRFNQIKYDPTESEKRLVTQIHDLKQEMSTFYRETQVRLAKWARDDYEGVSSEGVANLAMMNVSLSWAAVNQRCSLLFNNQSKAEYRTVDESKQYDVEILREVDNYDKKVGKYNSDYQDIELTANIEGSCFFRTSWEETFDKMGNTKGVPHIKQQRVRMNDMWWDVAARKIDEANHMLERKKMGYQRYLRLFVPLEKKEGFKNVRAVTGMSDDYEDEIWSEDWEKDSDNTIRGDKVTLWFFESLGFIEDGEIKTKCVIIANGVVIYESDKLFTPCEEDEIPLLSWDKIDGIPSGKMIGMGVPVLIRHIQEARNRLLTLSVAQAEIAVVPPVILGPGVDWDFDDSPLVSGRVIRSRNNSDDVRRSYHWFQPPDVTQGALSMIERLDQDAIMLTGVDIRALFVPASEKAITTVNKREIQEKTLRYSVQWNEENGYYGLALRRLRFLQYYYPRERSFLENKNGETKIRKGYLRVPLKDYETEEIEIKGKKKTKLNFRQGGYTKIDITPENLVFDVDLVIEGATTWQEGNAIEKKNFLDGLQVANTIPAFGAKIDENPDKFVKVLIKKLNLSENDIFEETRMNNQNQHPALKEVAAINLIDAYKDEKLEQYFEIEGIDDYDPNEYVDVFKEVFRSEQYKGMTKNSQDLFNKRFALHQKNAKNPYFFDIQKKNKEAEAQEQAPDASAVSTGLPPQEETPDDLMGRMKSESAKIASLTK